MIIILSWSIQGGIGINDVDNLSDEIEQQIQFGIQEADLLLFVVDARDGMTSLDETISKRLRATNKPLLLVANKCDADKFDIAAEEFTRFGYGEPVKVSAANRLGRDDLIEAIASKIPEVVPQVSDLAEPEMKIAIVGRRNVGKSTFVNTLTQSDRMIVSEVAGTTRDSVNVRFEMDDKAFVAIDTPGLRKNKSVRTDIDWYGTHRAQRSIRHADVVLMFFDSSQRLSKVDKQLLSYIQEHFKPCIMVVNKWDLMAEHMPTQQWSDYLRENFQSMWQVPIAFITGQTGKNVRKLLSHAQMLFKQSRERVSTGELNRLIRTAIDKHPPPMVRNRRPKIFYATQVGIQPPTVVLMCNDPQAFAPTYLKYLKGFLHDQLSFGEVPIRVFLQKRDSHGGGKRKHGASGAGEEELGREHWIEQPEHEHEQPEPDDLQTWEDEA
jgi:GTP-binding protein